MNTDDPITLTLAGMIVGQSLLALAILPVSRGDTQMKTTLGVFLGAMAVAEAFPLAASAVPSWAGPFFFLTLPAQLLCAPAFWLYIRETTASPVDARLGRHDLAHAGPALFALVVLVLALFLNSAARESLALDADVAALDHEGVTAFGVILVVLAWFVQLIGYGVATVRRLLRQRRRIRDHFANLEGRELNWVTLLLAAVVAYFAQAFLLGLVLDVPDRVSGTVDGVATVILVCVLCLFGLKQVQTFGQLVRARKASGSGYRSLRAGMRNPPCRANAATGSPRPYAASWRTTRSIAMPTCRSAGWPKPSPRRRTMSPRP